MKIKIIYLAVKNKDMQSILLLRKITFVYLHPYFVIGRKFGEQN